MSKTDSSIEYDFQKLYDTVIKNGNKEDIFFILEYGQQEEPNFFNASDNKKIVEISKELSTKFEDIILSISFADCLYINNKLHSKKINDYILDNLNLLIFNKELENKISLEEKVALFMSVYFNEYASKQEAIIINNQMVSYQEITYMEYIYKDIGNNLLDEFYLIAGFCKVYCTNYLFPKELVDLITIYHLKYTEEEVVPYIQKFTIDYVGETSATCNDCCILL